jgi:hypothetical protein
MSLSVVNVMPQDSRRVRVHLTEAPQAVSPALLGDATNIDVWSFTNTRTLEATIVLTAQYVGIDLSTYPSVDLFLAKAMDARPNRYEATCPTLLSALGVLIVPPTSAQCYGLGVKNPQEEVGQVVPFDLANRPSPSSSTVGGTLVIGPNGDYTSESGVSLLKKLILRRLTTSLGGFFHLPEYGIGLEDKVLVHDSDLPRLKRQIEHQIAREPDISEASVQLTWNPSLGILEAGVSGYMVQSGMPFSVSTNIEAASRPKKLSLAP